MSKLRIVDLREINEELRDDKEMFGWNYKYEKPSNRFLDRLFNHSWKKRFPLHRKSSYQLG